jgi:outer membrane lipoprotein-sorting protein
MRIRQAAAIGLLALTPALTGCLRHTHSVLKTRLPDIVLSSSLDTLLKQVDDRYAAIQSMTAPSIHIVATEGGSHTGEVTEYISFSGYFVIGKPENIDIILKLPYVGSDALHMVSDGKTFKMLMPPKDCAIIGSDIVTNSAQTGLYSLRPAVILDSLMIRGRQDDQVVTMNQDSRTLPDPKTHKDVIEEPDYDIEFLSRPDGQVAHTLRVIHIGRATLLPYRQDIYNSEGKVETQAFYDNYKKFGDIMFPTKIEIQRPLDELSLTVTISKATFNGEKLPDDQFKLDIPPNTTHVTNMDDPASASITNPCAAHAPQSTH